jgi:hypothetical protein
MKTVVASAVQAPRSLAWLVGGFACSLGLAAAGIYGVWATPSFGTASWEMALEQVRGASRGS